MRIELEKRAQPSQLYALLSPIIALALTLLTGAILFAALGQDPVRALYVLFIGPLTEVWSSASRSAIAATTGTSARKASWSSARSPAQSFPSCSTTGTRRWCCR